MRFIARVLTMVTVMVIGTLFAAAAAADPLARPVSQDARGHLIRGNRLYGVRSFEEAATEYKAGAVIEPAPVFDYNLGQCFRQLGKYQDAIWHYERFLSRGKPQGELLDAVNGFIAQMKAELDRKAMTQPPTDPAPLPRAEPVAAHPQGEQIAAPHTQPWYADRIGWGLTGAGVVGVGLGTGFLVSAASLTRDANSTIDQQQRAQLRDKASSRTLVGGVVGVAGTGLIVAGIVKLALHRDEPAQATAWTLTPSRNGLALLGHF